MGRRLTEAKRIARGSAGRHRLLPRRGQEDGCGGGPTRGNLTSVGGPGVFSFLALALLTVPILAGTAPFTPANDSVVIAHLRTKETSSAERQLRSSRATLAADPTNLALALDLARQCLRRFRTEADPRFLGQAEVALAPCWTHATPPVEALVLRATIRQCLHDFPAALADLDAALAREPRHAGAWLTKATIHTVRAEYAEARRAAAHLLGLTDALTATTAIAQIVALDGDTAAACRQLEAALDRDERSSAGAPNRDSETRVWALTVLAEGAAHHGQKEAAERHFRAALRLAPTGPYLLGAFADFLLDEGRPSEVIALLRDHARLDGLLLRLAEAQRADQPGSEAGSIAELKSRFAAAQARGDRVHLREEARFLLHLLNDPAAALPLAEANWLVQKEPADARLLREVRRQTTKAEGSTTKAQ